MTDDVIDEDETTEKEQQGAFFFPKVSDASQPPPPPTDDDDKKESGPGEPSGPSGPTDPTGGPDGFFFSKMARDRNLQVDEQRQSQSGMSYPKMGPDHQRIVKKDGGTSAVIKPATDKEERFVLTVEGLTKDDLNYLAFMGSYMEDMGYIPINHPAVVVKMAIEHLLASIRQEIEEQEDRK